MPSPFFKQGLIEALQDFGIDVSSLGRVPMLADLSMLTVAIGNLALNYEPTLNARAFAVVDIPAGGAGQISIISFQVRQEGLWLTDLWNQRINGRALFLEVTGPGGRRLVGAGTTFNWQFFGQEAGEVAASQGVTDPFTYFNKVTTFVPAYGYTNIVPPLTGATMRVQNTINSAHNNMPGLPLWIPGNSWLNIYSDTVNDQLNCTIGVQFPASCPGHFS